MAKRKRMNGFARSRKRSGRRRLKARRPARRLKATIRAVVQRSAETHHLDWSFVSLAASNTWTLRGPWSTITQGPSDVQRIGDRCKLLNLRVVNVFTGASSGDLTNRLRVIWFRFTGDSNHQTPDIGQLLQIKLTNQLEYQRYYEFDRFVMNKKNRLYHVLSDRTYKLQTPNSAATNSVGRGVLDIKQTLRLNSHVSFFGGGTTGTGHIYMFVCSDSVITPHPTVQQTARLTFKDI